MPDEQQFHAIGRRKTASARVFLSPGNGDIVINDRDPEEYFERRTHVAMFLKPLQHVDMTDEVDIIATVQGGGKTGQSDALQLGIARALTLIDPELRSPLKDEGYLTRDDRVKERKKYGQAGARKKFQYSKR
ncbi:MAG: 30S ribosomal protein S9 [Bradymonadaceae bacterium]